MTQNSFEKPIVQSLPITSGQENKLRQYQQYQSENLITFVYSALVISLYEGHLNKHGIGTGMLITFLFLFYFYNKKNPILWGVFLCAVSIKDLNTNRHSKKIKFFGKICRYNQHGQNMVSQRELGPFYLHYFLSLCPSTLCCTFHIALCCILQTSLCMVPLAQCIK